MLSPEQRMISRVLYEYTICRLKKKHRAQDYRIRELDSKERAARRDHRATRPYEAERSRIVHQRLARELGRA